MSESKNIDDSPGTDQKIDVSDSNIAVPSDVSSLAGDVKYVKHATTSERQMKFEKAQRCLENAALVSKRIKEHRKATAELLGRPFEEDVRDTTSEMASTMSEKTGYSVATDTSTTLSVQDALNIPGISESLANTLKQKELLMERIKQYKEISKRPMKKGMQITRKDSVTDTLDIKKGTDRTDVTKLINTIKEKENNLSIMQVKMKAMETTILDLQEKINEKDQIIEAKNKATTLISDSLSKKEKETMDLLEDTKQQMIKMQTNFVNMEAEWKEEKQKLVLEIEEKNERIKSLEEANLILENSRFEISVAHSKLLEEVQTKSKEILDLQEKIKQLSDTNISEIEGDKKLEEEKGSLEISNMNELSKKIELLEQINFEIRQTNKDLENQLASINVETKTNISPSKKGSPLPVRKGGRGTTSKMKSPWSHLSSESLQQEQEKKNKTDKSKPDTLLQSLNKDILDKEFIISQKNSLISELQSEKDNYMNTISKLEHLLKTQKEVAKMSDIGISADFSSEESTNKQVNMGASDADLEHKLKLAQEQIAVLNEEIDVANKNMIKVKSNSKLKLKQMQKTIENFSKVSDTHAEIVRLNEDIHQLSQKVAELEEEKGNLQLHLVDYDSGRLTETEIYKKMIEMENLAEARLKSISLLEAQKFDLVQELHSSQQKTLELEDKIADISQLQNEQVCSEMKSVQLEEQIDELQASKKELALFIENLKLDKEQLSHTIKSLQDEKEEIIQKLESYIQENIELTDKLEKLSAEKVSSAESIEIVESLTTQEKLELEEYNQGLENENKINKSPESYVSSSQEHQTNIQKEKLMEETIELKNKIELFTFEREEVMEKMSKLSLENESLTINISELKDMCKNLRSEIDMLNEEKQKLLSLNIELNHQIEELKQERSEILKESAEIAKPLCVEDTVDGSAIETVSHDDKSSGDKSVSKTKSIKQLTKEILKLKNTIKEKDDDIADLQMKILSLEEQQEKHTEVSQNQVSLEKLVKKLTDENNHLKKDIESISKDNKAEQYMQLVQAHELLQLETRKMHQEYTTAVNVRDSRIHELENLLLEYEKQVINYNNSLQQKDKEISEHINQITKLNDVSQKLKSTIDVLEEEKAKDQNVELIKSLNKQINLYQKSLADYEEKLRTLEGEKVQLTSIKSKLENEISCFELDMKKLQESLAEKQGLIKDLQTQQQKQTEELANVMLQSKERDEEIHEIKLQLRKESIDNEKLHNIVVQKSNDVAEFRKLYEEAKEKLHSISSDNNVQNEQYLTLEMKNKELMEKLKKFAVNIKKKSTMYTELEQQYETAQKQLETKTEQYEQLLIQVETIPSLQEKLKHAEEEFNRLQSQKIMLEQKSQEILQLKTEIDTLRKHNAEYSEVNTKLNETLNLVNTDLHFAREENNNLKIQIESLNNKIVEHEIEQKNNSNLLTKISCLEADLLQKQSQIEDLSNQVEIQNEKLSQIQFGYNAKIQENDMYIESLQSEIDKYKNRIGRLEESISVMECRRQSLERKADNLDTQLQDKQKAYSEYTNQEDELVTRLAVLIDNDRVTEKQLYEIECENKELRLKITQLIEERQHLQNSYAELQNKCIILENNAKHIDKVNSEILMYQTHIRELDTNLKRLTNEYNTLLLQKKKDIEELESEFNVQIENAIKEKKILSEKYEKISDRTSLLESKLQEYRTTIENLNLGIQELTLENQNLVEKFNKNDSIPAPDYTEQYISEINKLNSLINNKNQEILELGSKMQTLQTNNLSNISTLESTNMDLANKLETLHQQVTNLDKEKYILNKNNDQLQILISQKDEQIKQLMESKKLVFEMNIPKTEGMCISSSIEALDDEQKDLISSLQSQIISDEESSKPEIESVVKKSAEKLLQAGSTTDGLIEPVIVPKKTYLCYKEEGNDSKDSDPFNSEEGWGLEVSEETDDVTPGLSHLNQQIQKLDDTNKKLKLELDNANAKLSKALKKIKELKASNDMLSNELKLSKQISQSSMLDMTIESELSSNLEILEKEVQDLKSDLNKEKKEKEAVRKQNEVFKNANDRLLEMKEKMENELEMWKFNFKQSNDKLLSMQWGGDSKNLPDNSLQSTINKEKFDTSELEKEMLKVEKENDELQATIEKLYIQNKDLSINNDQLKVELDNVKQQLQNRQLTCDNCVTINSENKELSECRNQLNHDIIYLKERLEQQLLNCNNCLTLKKDLEELQKIYNNLVQNFSRLEENLRLSETRYNDLLVENESLKDNIKESENVYKNSEQELSDYNAKLMEKIQLHQDLENEANSNLSLLKVELENIKSKLIDAEEKEKATNSEMRLLNAELEDTKSKLNKTALEPNKNQEYDSTFVEKCTSTEEYYYHSLQNNLDDAYNKIHQLELDKNDLLDKVKNYDSQMCELNIKLQNLNIENDQLLSTVAELRSSVSSAMDQRGFEIAELWKQHLAQRENEFQKVEEDLRNQLCAFQAKYEQLFENVQSSSEEETKKIIMIEQINSLQKKIEDKEEHIINLRDKYAEVMNQLDLLRSEMEDEKVLHENKILLQQEEYEKLVLELNEQKEEQNKKYQNTIEELKTELDATKSVCNNLNQEIEEIRKSYEEKISDLTRQLQIKESELFQKTHDFTVVLTQRNEEFENVRKQLVDYEKKIEELTYEKESELAILRLKMHERAESAQKYQKDLENDKNNLTESLKEKIIEYTNTSKQFNELNKVLEEYANRATETQAVLESQELEIVTLKDEIISLQNALKSANSKVEKHVTFASDTKKINNDENVQGTLNRELLDAVPRAELDLALYMLHQRDVRCEELTMELTQLLEERDTLQLRLSDSLRSYEELKLRYNSGTLDTSVGSSPAGLSELPSFNVEKEKHFVDIHKAQTSRSSSISDPDGEKPKLQAKLSELRSVKHSRDVRLRQDSEQRQLGMRLLQRDVANLPPEAVEQLAQAHHTLSRDTQSTPTVLLNWLRGKSTPKVVHM